MTARLSQALPGSEQNKRSIIRRLAQHRRDQIPTMVEMPAPAVDARHQRSGHRLVVAGQMPKVPVSLIGLEKLLAVSMGNNVADQGDFIGSPKEFAAPIGESAHDAIKYGRAS